MASPRRVGDAVARIVAEAEKSGIAVYRKTYPPSDERYGYVDDPFVARFCDALGVSLYSHQAEAISHVIGGRHVCIMTPTASGKTLSYHIPVIRGLAGGGNEKALFLYPLKALAQDQRQKLEFHFEKVSPFLRCAIYDGDTPSSRRLRIRKDPPNCIITNPDMLHYSFLPSHQQWEGFLSALKYVVVDEVHAYRGIFGSNVAWVFKRFDRILRYYGADPVFICTSATVGNPDEFLRGLFSREFACVRESGAYSPEKHFLLINPDDKGGAYRVATKLLLSCLRKGLRTIVFTKARKITELIYNFLAKADPSLRDKVSSYRSGYLPAERREIENRLFSGELLGVISTSALELGIDIGSLDVCILVGYPGSIMNTIQRSGRVGRGRNAAAVFLVAQEDALDQYFMTYPDHFFERGCEDVVVDPANETIAERHICCAAGELPLRRGEDGLDPVILEKLATKGRLHESQDGSVYFPAEKRPHLAVSIRDTGESYSIVDDGTQSVIGTISGPRVFAECHDGAVYLHRGVSYLVKKLDIAKRTIHAAEDDGTTFTRALSGKETEILRIDEDRDEKGFSVSYGRFRVTEKVHGFERKDVVNQNVLGREEIDMPAYTFETTGFVIRVPDGVRREIEGARNHFMGSLHATEHALIGLMPTVVLCDRFDIGGICYPYHPQTESAAIFIYDGYDGGAGLAKKGYERITQLIANTRRLLLCCPCETGCPSCIHSPKCGSGNYPLDKAGALILIQMLEEAESSEYSSAVVSLHHQGDTPAPRASEPASVQGDVVFFDLETQRLAAEVGGWDNAHLMGVSVAVTWDERGGYHYFDEKDVPLLIERLGRADLVVGYNIEKFDYRVLSGYAGRRLSFPSFDLCNEIYRLTRARISLKKMSTLNLGDDKSADGLAAVEWFRQGDMGKLREYCRKDVDLVRDLFLLLRGQRYLLCEINHKIIKLQISLPPGR